MQKTSLKIFCLSTKKFRWGTLRCFRKFRVSKNFIHKKGISLVSVEFFVSQCRKNSWVTLQGFSKFKLSKNFMHNKNVSRFSVKIFSLTVPKKFVGEPFGVSENLGYRKISCISGEGGITILRQKNFVSFYRKTL